MKKKQPKITGDPLSNDNLRALDNFKDFSDEQLELVRDFTLKYVSIVKDLTLQLMEEDQELKKSKSQI
ncbi:MAG: hypothetical protein MUF42_09285 [Cytophagaceae bacterium]|jgi:hypothetical protein|nr:hypothetical protein [Cytophagaceae bacterium]